MGQINGVGMESMGGINGAGVESGAGVKSMGWGWNLWGRGGLWGSPTALCPPPSPHQFHYDHNRAQFYVEDASTASALKQVSRKITDRDNYKVGGEGPGRSQGCGVGGWGGPGRSKRELSGVGRVLNGRTVSLVGFDWVGKVLEGYRMGWMEWERSWKVTGVGGGGVGGLGGVLEGQKVG